jgi:hypothetical protein
MEVKVVHCQGIGSRKHVLELGEPVHKRGITEADLSKPGLSGCTKSFALPVGQLSELSWPYRSGARAALEMAHATARMISGTSHHLTRSRDPS